MKNTMYILFNYFGKRGSDQATPLACSADEVYLNSIKAEYEERNRKAVIREQLISQHMHDWHHNHPHTGMLAMVQAMNVARQQFIEGLDLTEQEIKDIYELQPNSQYRIEAVPLLTAQDDVVEGLQN